jgi:hypothetical protein
VRNVDGPRSRNLDVQQGHSMQRDRFHLIQIIMLSQIKNFGRIIMQDCETQNYKAPRN